MNCCQSLVQSWEVDNLCGQQLCGRIPQRKRFGFERACRETCEDCEVAEGFWTESQWEEDWVVHFSLK